MVIREIDMRPLVRDTRRGGGASENGQSRDRTFHACSPQIDNEGLGCYVSRGGQCDIDGSVSGEKSAAKDVDLQDTA